MISLVLQHLYACDSLYRKFGNNVGTCIKNKVYRLYWYTYLLSLEKRLKMVFSEIPIDFYFPYSIGIGRKVGR